MPTVVWIVYFGNILSTEQTMRLPPLVDFYFNAPVIHCYWRLFLLSESVLSGSEVRVCNLISWL